MENFVDKFGDKMPGSWKDCVTDPPRAKTYIRELKSGVTGTIRAEQGRTYDKQFLAKLDAIHELAGPRTVRMRAVSGSPGCGKSSPFKAFLRSPEGLGRRLVWMTAHPRQTIMQDWKDEVPMGPLSWLHNTYEQVLRRQARVLVVDELSLMPPGWLDTLLMFQSSISHVVVLGDVIQCSYHSPNSESALSQLTSEAVHWMRGPVPYFHWTHRMPKVLSRALDIPTSSPVEGRILIRHHTTTRFPLICMTESETKAAQRLGYAARTVSSHQGGTYHTAQVMVHGTMLEMADPGLILTAASRVTDCLILVLSLNPEQMARTQRQPVLHALLHPEHPIDFMAVFGERLAGFDVRAPPAPWPAQLAREAAHAALNRASGTVYERAPAELAVHLTHEPVCKPARPVLTEEREMVDRPRTHLPRATTEGVMDVALCDIGPREERELHDFGGMSLVFEERQDEYNQPTSALFPHQKAKDSVLYRATIAKRLRRAPEELNRRDYQAKAFQASVLFGALLKIAELPREPQPLDEQLFRECVYDNEFVKLTKKTQAQLENAKSRADPDWKFNFVDHFIKSQVKGKQEALGQPAKAGQTLATCSDLVVLMFGPMVRYLRKMVMDRLPDNVFCNCGKSQADQSAWAKRFWADVPSTTSDYTGFDSTQRGDSLGLEYRLMRHFGLPEAWALGFHSFRHLASDLPDLYLNWKLTIVSSAVGPKQTGRDTGEPGTFDFNTYFNLALYQLMYEPPPGLPAAVGGDDLAANARLPPSAAWARLDRMFDVIAKVEYTDRPEFCGYYMTSIGCYKNPRILMLKTMWHLSKGDADAVDVNYAAEAATAYVMGDSLYKYCSWADLECLGWLLQYYHRHRPGLARHFFSEGGGRLPEPSLDAADPDFVIEARETAHRALVRARRDARLRAAVGNVGGLN